MLKYILFTFIKYVENYFKVKVKTLRSDNGTEVVQLECKRLFSERGMVHQRSIAGVTEQNERVERKHRHY